MRAAETWGGLFWLAIGLAVTWLGRDLGLGKLSEPGSGLAIFWIGLIMSGLSALVVLAGLVGGGRTLPELWAGTRWGRILFVSVLMAVYATFFETIGFVPGSIAVLLLLMFLVDPVRWWIALPVAFGAVFGIWAVLTKWLKIQLPAGLLSGILY